MSGANFLTPRMKGVGLGGLVAIWFVLLYVNVIAVPSPQEVPLTYKSGQAAQAIRQDDLAVVWEMHSLPAPARELPGTPKKNIFETTTSSRPLNPQSKAMALQKKQQALAAAAALAPMASEAPPTPPSPSPEEVARQQEALAAQAAQQQEHLRRQQLQEQMAQYRYLGFVNQNGIQKAFLGKSREIHILRQGDALDGKFVVVSIDATTVKLTEPASKLEGVLTLKKEDVSPHGN